MPNSLSSTDLSAFERLLTDISTRFVSVPPVNVDAEITGALQSLVTFLAVDRSTLFQWSADRRTLENTHHWVVEGCEPIPPFTRVRSCRIPFAGSSRASLSGSRT